MCRSRRELSNAYLLAKIGVDTAENEPLEVWGENSIQYSLHSLGPTGPLRNVDFAVSTMDPAIPEALRRLGLPLTPWGSCVLLAPRQKVFCAADTL